MAALSSFIVTHNDRYAHDCTEVATLKNGDAPEYMNHDRTTWRCAFLWAKKYGYPLLHPYFLPTKKRTTPRCSIVVHVFSGASIL
jgi:hypothetical protein